MVILINACAGVNCGPPSGVDNGLVIVGLTTFDSLARYDCDTGFTLNPPDQELRTCTAERVWSGPDPSCDRKSIKLQLYQLHSILLIQLH